MTRFEYDVEWLEANVRIRIAWLTDLHLNFVTKADAERFALHLATQCPDAVVISGDVSDGKTVKQHLEALAEAVPCPIYFVLGNHDFYRSSIGFTRARVAGPLQGRNLHYLTRLGVVQLCPGVALLGHDGWADGRNGDYANSEVELNDAYLIREFKHLRSRWERYQLMEKLADEAAAHFAVLLPRALVGNTHVIALTHVPPFAEAAFWQGGPTAPDHLPFFSNRCVGEVLLNVMDHHLDCRLTVLCGHTHEDGVFNPTPNIEVRSAQAEYGQPRIADILVVGE